MKRQTLLLTGTTGFIGYNFLLFALSNNFLVIDILRSKNKNNKKIKKLRNTYPNNYKNIFFDSKKSLSKKLNNINVDCFINFATLYSNDHRHDQVSDFIESNVTFPTVIYDIIHNRTKKIINFGSMMQHSKNKNLISKTLYAATKNAFEMIGNYYSTINKKTKFYNIKFYESFGSYDTRKKIIPTIIGNYKKNIITKIISKDLSLNIIHTDDIINSIMILINNNIKSGNYCIRNTVDINISDLISSLNQNLDKKIKVKYGSESIKSINHTTLKILPKWKPIKNLEKRIINTFKYETT
ncbi:NAD-dependent epimerase/dehydratase family protein [Candidatus Pelagibacter sp.]|nr:NAD-dependent epimerase/dehydratase family protein [Candidatus Pelagibacter sp.]